MLAHHLAPVLLALPALASGVSAYCAGSASPQQGVNDAIERGVEFLLARQLRDGSFGEHGAGYGSGATALALYALLESGLEPEHPAIRHGFAFLDGSDPRKVYTTSLQLLAYAELDSRAPLDKERRAHVEGLLERLLGWQTGGFGYPLREDGGGGARGDDPADLSNTQFGALGLWAAEKLDLRVPVSAYSDLLRATLAYQETPRTVDAPRDPDAPDRSSTGTTREAGFLYRVPASVATPRGEPRRNLPPEASPTGSMTAAGLTVLAIVRDGAGSRLRPGERRDLDESARLALTWLDRHFDPRENPGGRSWFYYYLYGVERVGAFFERETLGTHDWYAEGARTLLARQAPFGGWRGNGLETATSFALLFLERATAPTTGTPRRAPERQTSAGEVRLIATGRDRVTLWIGGFSERWLDADGRAPALLWARYLVDGREVARVEAKDSPDGRLPTRHTFTRPGVHRVEAQVGVADPRGGAELTLESGPLQLDVRSAWAPWMADSAAAAHANLLAERDGATPIASLEVSSGEESAERAVDGLEGTAWLADASDLTPTLTLVFDHTLRATELRLGPADARRSDLGRLDRLARARVVVDGHDTFYVDFGPDPLAPGVLTFERRRGLRRLDVTLLERAPGSGRSATLGLSEVVVVDGR